ncbi:MAG: hypothetical protein WBX00_02960 [Isosphaeraceae bacterium]
MTDATSGPKPSEPPSQPGPPDAMSQYFQAVRQALGSIEMTQSQSFARPPSDSRRPS